MSSKFEAILLNDTGDRFNQPIDFKGYNFIVEDVKDEYHTMSELYDHRRALTVALFNFMYAVDKSIRGDYLAGGSNHLYMKSKMHADGSMFEGYFIVMAITPEGQISYHYDLEYWNDFKIPEVERTPEWDGHTSHDVIKRLIKLV